MNWPDLKLPPINLISLPLWITDNSSASTVAKGVDDPKAFLQRQEQWKKMCQSYAQRNKN